MAFPAGFSFAGVYGLSTEVRDKLLRVNPVSIGQARRIPGVTPAAVALLLVALKRAKAARRGSAEAAGAPSRPAAAGGNDIDPGAGRPGEGASGGCTGAAPPGGGCAGQAPRDGRPPRGGGEGA